LKGKKMNRPNEIIYWLERGTLFLSAGETKSLCDYIHELEANQKEREIMNEKQEKTFVEYWQNQAFYPSVQPTRQWITKGMARVLIERVLASQTNVAGQPRTFMCENCESAIQDGEDYSMWGDGIRTHIHCPCRVAKGNIANQPDSSPPIGENIKGLPDIIQE
jgi:hypothetical protein